MDDFNEVDLLVIGGGPGGSTLGTLIAMKGYKVLLLEKEKFPRYQIGESLLPNTLGILKSTDALEQVDEAGFMPKNGGVWYWGSLDQPGWGFDFNELPKAPIHGKAWGYQVERQKFDEILLRNAARKGVDVRERHRVDELLEENGRTVGARFSDSGGKTNVVRAKIVADAGGHSSPFHQKVGKRVFAEQFRNLALFGYYRGGKRLPSPHSGSILNVSFDRGWFWFIPLSETLTSVGAVIGSKYADMLKMGYEAAMNEFIESCPMIKDYLSTAVRIKEGMYGQIRLRKDWSYCNTHFWKPGMILVGDTACFVDPLFSSGIHLATYSASLASTAVTRYLESQTRETEDRYFGEYEEKYRAEYYIFFRFLTEFYDLNKTKEQYFGDAHNILGTKETNRNSFIRLVSGFSTLRASSREEKELRMQPASAAVEAALNESSAL